MSDLKTRAYGSDLRLLFLYFYLPFLEERLTGRAKKLSLERVTRNEYGGHYSSVPADYAAGYRDGVRDAIAKIRQVVLTHDDIKKLEAPK